MITCQYCNKNHDEYFITCVEKNIRNNNITVAYYCDTCLDLKHFKSEHDNKYYPRSERVLDMITNTYVTRYQLAEERQEHCRRCDAQVHYTRMMPRIDDQPSRTCTSCEEERIAEERDQNTTASRQNKEGMIHNWNYRPSFIMERVRYEGKKGRFTKKQNLNYMGVELEVDIPGGSSESNSFAQELTHMHNGKNFYFKSDSTCDGFEVCSHPKTLEFHKKEMKWSNVLKQMQRKGITSYRDSKCGLHIHISKYALKKHQWWKVVYLFYMCRIQIKKFSQRAGSTQYCKITSPESYGASRDFTHIKNFMPSNSDRYRALNFLPTKTVEFRIFRGTLSIERFWSSLLFVDSLLSFATKIGILFILNSTGTKLWKEYTNLLKTEMRYQVLIKHLEKRGIFPGVTPIEQEVEL